MEYVYDVEYIFKKLFKNSYDDVFTSFLHKRFIKRHHWKPKCKVSKLTIVKHIHV